MVLAAFVFKARPTAVDCAVISPDQFPRSKSTCSSVVSTALYLRPLNVMSVVASL